MIKQPDNLTHEQLAEIVALWLQSNIDAHPFIKREYWESKEVEVASLLPKAELHFFEEDHKILGFIGLMDHYIAGIFVDKDYRGNQIGKKLLADAKKSRDYLELSVYQNNEKAIAFYLREGFDIIEEGIDEETNQKEYLMKWLS